MITLSLWDSIKDVVSKTNLANISAFIIVLALTWHALKTDDVEILKYIGFTAFGYLYGVQKKNG